MSDCIHDLDERWCSICKYGPPVKTREVPERRGVARYSGQCPCGESIDEGDLIGLVDGVWLGSCCIEVA